VLAGIALVVYLVIGLILLFKVGYAIGDAVARESQARSAVDSRDPHAASIGFSWMPLPVLSQLPLAAVLSRFGVSEVSGPLSTAIWAAATVPVVAAIGRRLKLPDAYVGVIAVIYAFNPWTIFYAANGMSEASFFFFLALACLGYISWCVEGRLRHLALLGLALSGATLVRYETMGVAAIVAVAVAFQSPKGRRVGAAIIVALPTAFAMFVWFTICKVLLGDALFFLKGGVEGPEGAAWLPARRTVAANLEYCLGLCLRFAPVLLLIVPLAFGQDVARVRSKAPRPFVALPIVAVAAVFPGQVFVLLFPNFTFGNPRYFSELIILGAVLAMVLVRPAVGVVRPALMAWLAAGLAFGWVTGYVTMDDRRVVAVENETDALRGLLGGRNEATRWTDWRTFAADLDRQLGPHDLVLEDSVSAFPVSLFSRRPTQFVITQDRDFEQIVAANDPRVTYVITTGDARADPRVSEFVASSPRGKEWKVVDNSPVAKLYHLQPAQTSSAAAAGSNPAAPGPPSASPSGSAPAPAGSAG
jgi:hypothetical protein